MKKTLWIAILLLLVSIITLSACELGHPFQASNDIGFPFDTDNNVLGSHSHSFGEWSQIQQPTCTDDGVKERSCSCGEKQTKAVEALGHNEVIDTAVAATCTTDGKTAGKHCSRCNAVLISQTVVSAFGHTYNSGEITTPAECNQNGVKTFTCTVSSCRHSYTESYSLPTYTATEIYNRAVQYVGEIVTYQRDGSALSLATGFVISSDGKVVTNYHVIEDAYSADITINGRTYAITSILAYDEAIDLAVLKVNATGLTAATICKKSVNVGDPVYAIGSSRGMTNTYSQGIITYANRVLEGVAYVQHDASITHGNSGGPLINAYGEVIGINSWGISDSQSLNFAVFTGELDNLVYGIPMSLAEFQEANFNAYGTLLNWLLDNYNNTGDGWIEYIYQDSEELYSVYSLTYFYNTDTLSLIQYFVFNNEDARYVAITLSEDASSCSYYATYTDGDNSSRKNTTEGYIYPSSFTRYSSIGYYSSEGNYWTTSSLLETYQEGMVYALDWFEIFLYAFEFDMTLSDFGFTSFS